MPTCGSQKKHRLFHEALPLWLFSVAELIPDSKLESLWIMAGEHPETLTLTRTTRGESGNDFQAKERLRYSWLIMPLAAERGFVCYGRDSLWLPHAAPEALLQILSMLSTTEH